jgi:ATP-dependent DNA helicase RecQ
LLKGEEHIQLRRDPGRSSTKQQTKTRLPADIDITLWEALRECRRELAEEQGVPPYVIFHDRSLQEMCAALPRNALQFGRISGVGERKLDKYGKVFLQVINEHLQQA